jgi:hypothetical protein
MKKTSKRERAFQIINTVLVVGILGFYLARLLYYKKYFDDIYFNSRDTAGKLFSDVIIASHDVSLTNNGLIKNDEDGSYAFKGDCSNNYVIYSNGVYRIMDVDAEGNVRIISQQPVTAGTMYDTVPFSQSGICQWLNKTDDEHSGAFYDTMNNPANFLIDSPVYENPVDDPAKPDYSRKTDEIVIRLLSLQDYSTLGGANSYLNNGSEFWLTNPDSNGRHWFVDSQGNVALSGSKVELKGIRVVLTITRTVIAKGGVGTKEDPYVLTENEPKTVRALESGSVISYSGYKWKVNSIVNGNAVLIMDGLVEQDGQPVVMEYGTKAEYTAKAKGGVLSYLNNTFLTSLNSYLTYLVENEWYYGAHEDVQGSYSPLDNYANTYKSYVSIPNNSYLFLADQKDYFLNTMSASTDKLIYTVSNDNLLYADLLENQHHIRAVICMNGQTRLLSGSGTPEDPYIVESPAQPEVN